MSTTVPSPSSTPSSSDSPETDEVTADNAADILAADDDPSAVDAEAPRRGRPSRRTLLTVGGLVAAAAVGTGAYLTIHRTNQGVIGAHETLPLVIGGDICAAPLYAAYHRGFFDDAGLKVTLARTQQTEDTKDGVGAGKYIGAPGIFFSWLEPIYNGLNAKLTAGLHAGCLRLVVGNDSPHQSLADLKGTTIGVPSLSSSAFAYFAIGLSEAGINVDPDGGDITWRTIDADSLGTALAEGQVDAIMGSDPAPLLPVFNGTARELANNDAEKFCCSVALNGDFVKRRPKEAKALTEAWMKGSAYVPDHIDEIAKIEVDNDYVAADHDVVVRVLKTYGFNASASGFRAAIEPGIEKFKTTGFITSDVSAQSLTNAVVADLGIED
ncbi:ABC transporter substrate-binding protein [uncultured Actinomyces sp.]|uniref:ABC transporter substrate-binding protein n=1 Tax=uncultured Actinomyces sp. TaxID=249061 RepID=UPI0028D888C6|nr:ABC transporter substrate-binding protein [uncultured Actinomyces sp.]